MRRESIAKQYYDGLCTTKGLSLPPMSPGRVWQDYVVRTKRRDDLFNFLKEKGVETLKNNYPFPVPKLPEAQKYEDETLRLPCNENLTDYEVKSIIDVIHEFYG